MFRCENSSLAFRGSTKPFKSKRAAAQADPGCDPDRQGQGRLGEGGRRWLGFGLCPKPTSVRPASVESSSRVYTVSPEGYSPSSSAPSSTCPPKDAGSWGGASGAFPNDPWVFGLQDDPSGGRGSRGHLLRCEKWAQERSDRASQSCPWGPLWGKSSCADSQAGDF